ncbi:histone deacetylase complex subunit SAP30 homolog isoform X1 [Dermacentor albipictus]|uniref:histone deacetylase complex subunit SAP30 homolog isoform X1 n=1 Tax=Dermacentor albipictus TaxID=60249 RepID=UPI0038FC5457
MPAVGMRGRAGGKSKSLLLRPASVSKLSTALPLLRKQQVSTSKTPLTDTSLRGLMNGFSTEEETQSGHNQICCLLDDSERCTRPAGNASYSKRIQKTVAQRKLKLNIDPSARHIYICDYHKGVIQSVRTKRKRKDSEDDNGSNEQEMDIPEVDLFQLQVNTLRRYKRHYKVPMRPGLNKAELADTLARHFRTIPIAEKEAITFFIYMVKNNKNKLDQKNGADPC